MAQALNNGSMDMEYIIANVYGRVMENVHSDISAGRMHSENLMKEFLLVTRDLISSNRMLREQISEIRTRLRNAERINEDLQQTNQALDDMRNRVSTNERLSHQRHQEIQQNLINNQHNGGLGGGTDGDGGAVVEGGDQDVDDGPNVEAQIEELKKNQQKILSRQEDAECKKSVIISGIALQNLLQDQPQHGQFIPRIKAALRMADLDFLMYQVENIKLFRSGALKLTYNNSSQARFQILTLRKWIGDIKRRYRSTDDEIPNRPSDIQMRAAERIKFCIATPRRFNSDRKILQSAAKHLKETHQIRWFDFLVLDNKMVVKACKGTGRNRTYTYIDSEFAREVISGVPQHLRQEE